MLCFRYYDGTTLECLAQTKPLVIKDAADRLRKFIKSKHKTDCNGIENVAFQEDFEVAKLKNSNSLEELTTNSKEIFSGVKKKSANGLVRSESTNIGGTKKKIRPKTHPRSPSKEYYQIWAASTSTENTKDSKLCDKQDAPPLPPRALHKPLERSHALHDGFKPPIVPREHKPKVIKKPEDVFEFDLIDTDETDSSLSPKTSERFPAVQDVNATPSHKVKAALIENGKRLIGSDNYITTFIGKKLDVERRNSSPLKDIAHPMLEPKGSQSSMSTHSSSSLEGLDSNETSSHIMLKPHKPLTRQISPSKAPEACTSSKHLDGDSSLSRASLQEKISSSSTDSDASESAANNPNKSEACDVLRPHPRALARVAGLMTDNLPVCPPTPTHHAKRSRKVELKPPTLKCASPKPDFPADRQEIVPSPEIRHADVRSIDTLDGYSSEASNSTENIAVDSRNSGETSGKESPRLNIISLSELRNVDTRSPDVRSQDLPRSNANAEVRLRENTGRDGEASGVIPLPLRHIRSTRLPSIPERSHRILTISEIPGECEEPLPPCK